MIYYVAIVEDEPGKAVGVWFPDIPGCFSAGDTVEEAMENACDAVPVWAEAMSERGLPMPRPRSIADIKAGPEAAEDVAAFMVALIPFEARLLSAAE